MSTKRCTVLTIGHSTHTLSNFLKLLLQHEVTAVADVRFAPYSGFNPQFNREMLAGDLKEAGINYVFLGKELGGRSKDPEFYEDGRISYERLKKTKSFQHGIHRVLEGAAKYRIALMCAEKEPLDCHRTLLVSLVLDEQGANVLHIHADGQLEPHGKAMDRLLELRELSGEELFRTREDRIAEAVAQHSRAVAHADFRQVPAIGQGIKP